MAIDFRTRRARFLLAAALLLFCAPGCGGAYYGAMERLGKEKRHILADRVENGRDAQEEAQQQLLSTYELFKEATGFEGGDLET